MKLDTQFQKLFDNYKNKKRIYTALAGDMHDAVEQNFETEGDRLGKKWAPLAESTIKRRLKKGYGTNPILQNKGDLVKSIQHGATETGAMVFTNDPRAGALFYGAVIEMAARTELFSRLRYKRGKKKGKFKKGTLYGKGFKRGAYTIVIPARNAFQFNDEDYKKFEETVKRNILIR